MAKDWESAFTAWAKPPGKTETDRCENAIKAIRNAIDRSDKLNRRNITVFVQGSYRNRVNVRRDSDVDVGVLCSDVFFANYHDGTTAATFDHRDADYRYPRFKDELQEALETYFGKKAVHRGNKAFDLKENTYHVEADVVPLFEYHEYWKGGSRRCGVELRPDNGGRIQNYPERLLDSWPNIPLHYENAVEKNAATGRAFKGVVRILKSLCVQMETEGITSAQEVPGFLIECLAWNVPNPRFGFHTWDATVQSVLGYLWSNTKDAEACRKWCEVNNIKYLFHSSQGWTRAQAHTFVDEAWDYVGVRQ